MFKVTYLHQNIVNITPILSGVTFGFFSKPLFFKINAEMIKSDLMVSFIIDRGKVEYSKLNVGKIENNKLNIIYNIPEIFTNSGLTNPTSILVVNEKILAVMFQVTKINDSSYKLEYEFYEGFISSEEDKK